MNPTELTIEVASRIEAGDILQLARHCAEVICLLSIGDVNDELPVGFHNVARKRRLLVADVVTEFGATEEDVREIITLAEDLSASTGRVLIHCGLE